jgi:hypothetical protein
MMTIAVCYYSFCLLVCACGIVGLGRVREEEKNIRYFVPFYIHISTKEPLNSGKGAHCPRGSLIGSSLTNY